MARNELLQRYRDLPLPTTKDEPWRFTDLRGFDPDSFREGAGTVSRPRDARPGRRRARDVGEAGLRVERAPEGVTFERLDENHERLHQLVGWDEKFAAHNAALWQNGLLVLVPRGVVLDEPLYVQIANSVDGRLALLAPARRRRGGRALLADRGVRERDPGLRGYSNAVVELFVEQGAKLEYVSLQNLSRETWHFATHHARVGRDAELDWVAGGFGSKKGKIRIQNDLAGQGATSRVTGAYFADASSTSTTTRSRSTSRPTRPRLRLQGRAARQGADGVARDDPRREGARRRRTPTRRTGTCCCRRTRMRTRSRASRSWRTTCAARTARRSVQSTATSSST